MDPIDSQSHTFAHLKEELMKMRSVRRLARIERLLQTFTPVERLALYILTIMLALSAFTLVVGLSREFSEVIPANGGAVVEGEVGPVRFINPLLALSQADGDLTQLVYSGLMRALPNGTYTPDLANNYTISDDGTEYTFDLRTDATFQDGTPVTSADVLYTISLAQNPAIKSSRQADWSGVRISAPDAHTVVFTLPHPYAPFIENTTLGILPKHAWENVSAEEFPFSPLNIRPIGSGPYKVTDMTTDSTGSATRYELVPFARFTHQPPFISHLTIRLYPNEAALIKAFNSGVVTSVAGVNPEDISKLTADDAQVLSVPLPRVFGIFFNQGKNQVFTDPAVRAALNAAIDKRALVQNILNGFGTPLDGPLPPGIVNEAPHARIHLLPVKPHATSSPIVSERITNAQAILQRAGWKFDNERSAWIKGKQTLSFTLATADEPELTAAAREVASAWQAAGVQVTVQIYPLSELSTNVLRPRTYDAILFGQVAGRTGDFFAFWHSSQRTDPGLNLALYANTRVDQLLSQARADDNPEERMQLYKQFAQEIEKEQPAVFLFSPDFLYVIPRTLNGVKLGSLGSSAERFLNVTDWYTETARVWTVFTR